MHRYEVKDGKDCFIYRDDEIILFATNWDTEHGAHNWGAIMVEKLDAEAAETAEADA